MLIISEHGQPHTINFTKKSLPICPSFLCHSARNHTCSFNKVNVNKLTNSEDAVTALPQTDNIFHQGGKKMVSFILEYSQKQPKVSATARTSLQNHGLLLKMYILFNHVSFKTNKTITDQNKTQCFP